MMNTKVLILVGFLVAICTFSVFARTATDKEIDLIGSTKEGGLRSSGPVDNFVKAIINNSSRMLEFEFFDSADDVTISVADEHGNIIYEETLDTCNTLHKYIQLGAYQDGYYEINIYNSRGVNIFGCFWLE